MVGMLRWWIQVDAWVLLNLQDPCHCTINSDLYVQSTSVCFKSAICHVSLDIYFFSRKLKTLIDLWHNFKHFLIRIHIHTTSLKSKVEISTMCGIEVWIVCSPLLSINFWTRILRCPKHHPKVEALGFLSPCPTTPDTALLGLGMDEVGADRSFHFVRPL